MSTAANSSASLSRRIFALAKETSAFLRREMRPAPTSGMRWRPQLFVPILRGPENVFARRRRSVLLRRKLGRYRRDPKHLYSFRGAM
jgi:hypothetical protein